MEKLSEARRRKAVSMRELAAISGVGLTTIARTESGESIPRFSVIERLSRALDVNPLDIEEFYASLSGETKKEIAVA